MTVNATVFQKGQMPSPCSLEPLPDLKRRTTFPERELASNPCRARRASSGAFRRKPCRGILDLSTSLPRAHDSRSSSPTWPKRCVRASTDENLLGLFRLAAISCPWSRDWRAALHPPVDRMPVGAGPKTVSSAAAGEFAMLNRRTDVISISAPGISATVLRSFVSADGADLLRVKRLAHGQSFWILALGTLHPSSR